MNYSLGLKQLKNCKNLLNLTMDNIDWLYFCNNKYNQYLCYSVKGTEYTESGPKTRSKNTKKLISVRVLKLKT